MNLENIEAEIQALKDRIEELEWQMVNRVGVEKVDRELFLSERERYRKRRGETPAWVLHRNDEA